jgi:TolB protein
MFIKTFFKPLLFAAALSFLCTETHAQAVRVVKGFGESTKNPTLHINPVSGDGEIAARVKSSFALCGWFDVVPAAASADFTVHGSYAGGVLALNLRNAGGGLVSAVRRNINPGRVDLDVYRSVDDILRDVFKIPGICATRIAFSVKTSSRAKNIYICDFDGRNVTQITRHNSLCVEPEWFPDGASILYTMYGHSTTNIVQTVLAPLKSRLLVSMRGLNTGGAVSPNGKYMALVMSRDNQVEIYVKEVESGKMRRLTHDKAVEASPCWSPDGGSICYVSDLNGRPGLYMISANGGAATRLSTAGVEATSPAWAKNGSIAYSSRSGRSYALAILSKDTRVKSGILVEGGGNWESPSWAPDSRHIICSRNTNGHSTLYVVDSWTGKVRKLLSSRHDMTYPSWSNPY